MMHGNHQSKEPRGPRQPTLTITLTTLTVTLVLMTVAMVVWVITLGETQAREDIELRYGRTSTLAVAATLGRYLSTATPLLTEAHDRAERGTLKVDDLPELDEFL